MAEYGTALYNIARKKIRNVSDVRDFVNAVSKLNRSKNIDEKAQILYEYLIDINEVDNINKLNNKEEIETINNTLAKNQFVSKFGLDANGNEILNNAQIDLMKKVYASNGRIIEDPNFYINPKDIQKVSQNSKVMQGFSLMIQTLQQFPSFHKLEDFLQIIAYGGMYELYRKYCNSGEPYDELSLPKKLFEFLNNENFVGNMIYDLFFDINNMKDDKEILEYIENKLTNNNIESLGIDINKVVNNIEILIKNKVYNDPMSFKQKLFDSEEHYLKNVNDSTFERFIKLAQTGQQLSEENNKVKSYIEVLNSLRRITLGIISNINNDILGIREGNKLFVTKISYVDKNINELISIMKLREPTLVALKTRIGETFYNLANDLAVHINSVSTNDNPQRIVLFKESEKNNIYSWLISLLNDDGSINYNILINGGKTKVFEETNLNIYNAIFTLYSIMSYNFVDVSTKAQGLLDVYTLIKNNII